MAGSHGPDGPLLDELEDAHAGGVGGR
jgi:hypothetical protein